jgi:uncharacterized protein YpmB
MRKNIILIGMVFSIIAMLMVPQAVMALSTGHTYDHNPVPAGSSDSISLSIRNTETQQIYVRRVQVVGEWRTTPYEWTGSVGIPSTETRSVTVDFDVPENVPTTAQTVVVTVYYSTNSATGALIPESYTYTDLVVEPAANEWPIIMIVLIIAVVIIVVSVSYLYVKKKPQVHIHNTQTQVQAEKDDPKTRIRAPAQHASYQGSNATQVVGAGGAGAATMVTAPGGGLEVLFPKGSKKIVTNEMVIGREDFAHLLDASVLPRISKSHLRIYKEGGNYFIEDGYRGKASTNGTKLNGREIRGSGPQQIVSASTISLSDVVDLQLTMNK